LYRDFRNPNRVRPFFIIKTLVTVLVTIETFVEFYISTFLTVFVSIFLIDKSLILNYSSNNILKYLVANKKKKFRPSKHGFFLNSEHP